MKSTLILCIMAAILLAACDKTDDEVRAENAAKARAEKNMAQHEKK
jgi:nitrous oxide reductase accessory protein NosL